MNKGNEQGVRLQGGSKMPIIGFGTVNNFYNAEGLELAVETAIKLGYRHFDTAMIYNSEVALGRALNKAINDKIVQREELFVTSKLWCNDHHDPVSAVRQTLRRLEMEYVDLYLIHFPAKFKPWAPVTEPTEDDFDELDLESTWAAMEKCVDMGLCKNIGVSNFSSTKIQHILDYASIIPAVNQVEMHPLWRQKKLREFCAEHKIHVSAYGPLGGYGTLWGSNCVLDNSLLQSIALKHKATTAQVALGWGLSKGVSVIVKSFNEGRIKENMKALTLRLDEEDVAEIERLEERRLLDGTFLVNGTTSPYKSLQDLWDE
ncbi:hypothetical protein NE237_012212 [Protea cynaroides]|uniref:NADP-dependent oxidoreductase domain-containing protein n=1 Tax=Protea cynaroides TaxID=273540 RepID=A0A9Q0JWL6_9MAGN|nr:hypothetical protein NE237_012212 [Protea cynaroides]